MWVPLHEGVRGAGMRVWCHRGAGLAGDDVILPPNRVTRGVARVKSRHLPNEAIVSVGGRSRECSRPLQPYTEHFTEFARIVYAHNKWAWLEAPTQQQFSAQFLSRFSWQLTRYEPQSKAKGITHWIENRVARKS